MEEKTEEIQCCSEPYNDFIHSRIIFFTFAFVVIFSIFDYLVDIKIKSIVDIFLFATAGTVTLWIIDTRKRKRCAKCLVVFLSSWFISNILALMLLKMWKGEYR